MDKLEKAIKGLGMLRETCGCTDTYYMNCESCVYNGERHCVDSILRDALALLKERQPRVMPLEEVRLLCKDDIVWYEHKGVFRQPRPRVVEFVFDEHIAFTDGGVWSFSADGYGERWRLWTSRPEEKVRAETPWES